MAKSSAKLSVSVPSDLASAVRERVGSRGLSSFVARALQHELEREELSAFLADLDDTHGPLSAAEVAEARRAWPKR